MPLFEPKRTKVDNVRFISDSELWLPIGTIIAERIKYGKQPLEIVNIDGKQFLDKDLPIATEDLSLHDESLDSSKPPAPSSSATREVKRLIQDMTRVIPEDRLSAPEVVLRLQALRSESPVPAAVTSAPPSEHKVNVYPAIPLRSAAYNA